MLSHGAIIAREFGIPSVVGVADATRADSRTAADDQRRRRSRARSVSWRGARMMLPRLRRASALAARPLFCPLALVVVAGASPVAAGSLATRSPSDVAVRASCSSSRSASGTTSPDRERDRVAHPDRVARPRVVHRAARRRCVGCWRSAQPAAGRCIAGSCRCWRSCVALIAGLAASYAARARALATASGPAAKYPACRACAHRLPARHARAVSRCCLAAVRYEASHDPGRVHRSRPIGTRRRESACRRSRRIDGRNPSEGTTH